MNKKNFEPSVGAALSEGSSLYIKVFYFLTRSLLGNLIILIGLAGVIFFAMCGWKIHIGPLAVIPPEKEIIKDPLSAFDHELDECIGVAYLQLNEELGAHGQTRNSKKINTVLLSLLEVKYVTIIKIRGENKGAQATSDAIAVSRAYIKNDLAKKHQISLPIK